MDVKTLAKSINVKIIYVRNSRETKEAVHFNVAIIEFENGRIR